ncbi:MAG TPA: TlpA disulfide reductase family protein [Fluviicoccus sp.]|nr:TlpA disulfide reductase family protein [Fluviicoccus sp.]
MTLRRTAVLLILLALTAMPVSARLQNGDMAPPVSARLLDGKTRLLLSGRDGRVTVISFWASWCPPCRHELPELDKLYRTYHEQGLDMLAISADEETADIAAAQRLAAPLQMPVALMTDTRADGYGRIRALPMLYVVDRQGRVRVDGWAGMQMQDFPALEQLVKSLLAESPPAP